MIFSIEILLLSYVLLSILAQALAHSLKQANGFCLRLALLGLTIATASLYYFAKPTALYLSVSSTMMPLAVMGHIWVINSILLFFKHQNIKMEPLYFNLINAFAYLALVTDSMITGIIGIIAIRFIEIAISLTSEVGEDVPSQFKQLIKLIAVSIALGAMAIFNSQATAIGTYLASGLLIMAIVLDSGLLNLRIAKRIELENQTSLLLLLRWAGTNTVIAITYLFFLHRMQSPLNHQVLLVCLIITLIVQLIGFTQSRTAQQILARLYIVNMGFIFLLFSYCKDAQMLLVGLIYTISLHLVIPLSYILLNQNFQKRWNRYEKVLIFISMGWLTLLPLPSSFFPRLSLMLMNGGSGNGYFYFLYLIVLIVAISTLLHRGIEYRQVEQSLPSHHNYTVATFFTVVLVLIGVAGSVVGLMP